MADEPLSAYEEAISYLFGLQKYGIKFGLNSTQNILSRLGDPHYRLRCIHIAGTNGKGSTAAMLASILRCHGLRVGLYTSPHLVRFTERFRINDREATKDAILEVYRQVREVLNESDPPTFFEMVTAMAFQYFCQEAVDWAVIEVGMGGRLDATNVIHPHVTVITNVAFDHQEFLGNTLAEIGREKAGIIKTGVPLITGVQQPLLQAILKATCLKNRAPIYRLGTDFSVKRGSDGSVRYDGIKHQFKNLRTSLLGNHQIRNAALSLATLEMLEKNQAVTLDEEAVRRGLLEVFWPARLEVLQDNPLIILDGAHNPQGAESLRDALRKCYPERPVHFVLGIMADKDIRGILRRLLPTAQTAIFTQPRYSRAAHPEYLRKLARPYLQKIYVIPDVNSAISQAKSLARDGELICVTGSLYFAGEVKELFGEPV